MANKPERLTGWDGENAYCLVCFESNNGDGCKDMDTSKCDFCEHPQAVYRRCATYEDTGATPEQCAAALRVCWCNDCRHGNVVDDGIMCMNQDSGWWAEWRGTYDSCEHCERRVDDGERCC